MGGTGLATTSYGTCDGDWYVWSVNWGMTNSIGPRNKSAFGPNYSRKIADFKDGLSGTLFVSEGYIGHPQFRGCLNSPSVPSDPSVGTFTPDNVPPPGPLSAQALLNLASSCGAKPGHVKDGGLIGHTRWTNGGVYYTGFTTAMPPNAKVLVQSQGPTNAGQMVPADWDSVDENDGGPTYMSLTASSYHPAGVNVLFADGHVQFIKDSVNPVTWRALGTIAKGEIVSSDQY
jgi:prepilin-type processing-associated H-X9-DG protein